MLTANLYALKWGLSSVVDSISLAGTQCYNKLPMSVRKIRRPSIDLIKPHKESTNEDNSAQNEETEEKADKIIMMTSEKDKNNESVQESKQEKTEPEKSSEGSSVKYDKQIFILLQNSLNRWIQNRLEKRYIKY